MLDESFSVLLPNADDFGLAKRYLGQFETGLRAETRSTWQLPKIIMRRRSTVSHVTLLKAGKILYLPVSIGIQI